MNTATKNLENDHVHILQLIDVMENATQTDDPNVEDLEVMINIIKKYADGLHHAKEENLLFPLMTNRGFSLEQGPIAVMLHEHDLGRNYVKGMTENLEKYKGGDKKSISTVFENMLGYCELLRGHIHKENNILFKMADNALTADDQQSLLKQFEQIETDGKLNDFLEQLKELNKIYKP